MDTVKETLSKRSFELREMPSYAKYKYVVMVNLTYDGRNVSGYTLVGYNDKDKAEALLAMLEILDDLEDGTIELKRGD
jgi:hypothetical protein